MLPTTPPTFTPPSALQRPALQSALTTVVDLHIAITGHTCIVMDNSNILHGSLGRGFRVDSALVLEQLSGEKLVSATMSVSNPPHDRPCQNAYYDWVKRLGWKVNGFDLLLDDSGQLIENERLVDGDVRKQIRAAAKFAHCDTIVVLGGDGGYVNAVKEARCAGKTIVVIAWEGTLHPALAAAASTYASVESLRDLIGRAVH